MQKIVIATVAALALLPIAASAGEVQDRINTEHARINGAVASGQLSYWEARRLDESLASIQAQRNRDLAADGGRLSYGEDRQLNLEEDNVSNRISWERR